MEACLSPIAIARPRFSTVLFGLFRRHKLYCWTVVGALWCWAGIRRPGQRDRRRLASASLLALKTRDVSAADSLAGGMPSRPFIWSGCGRWVGAFRSDAFCLTNQLFTRSGQLTRQRFLAVARASYVGKRHSPAGSRPRRATPRGNPLTALPPRMKVSRPTDCINQTAKLRPVENLLPANGAIIRLRNVEKCYRTKAGISNIRA